jgi:hypothetical protein
MADEIERGLAREHYGSPSFDGHVSSVQWSMKKVFVCLFRVALSKGHVV